MFAEAYTESATQRNGVMEIDNSRLNAFLHEMLGIAGGDCVRASRYALRRLLRDEYEDLLFALVLKEMRFIAGAAARRNRDDCSAGQRVGANSGQFHPAGEQSTDSDDGGQQLIAHDGHSANVPTSLPNDDEVGHSPVAQGQNTRARPSSPNCDADAVLPVPHHGQNQAAPASLTNDGDGSQVTIVRQDHSCGAPTPSLNGDGDAKEAVPSNGQPSGASSSPTERDDGGHISFSSESQVIHATSSQQNADGRSHSVSAATGHSNCAPPIREPSAIQRAAAFAAANMLAKSSLDTFRVRDGRAIGDVRWREIDALIAENSKEAAVLDRIKQHYQVVDQNVKVREVIKPSLLDQIISDVEKEIRNAA